MRIVKSCAVACALLLSGFSIAGAADTVVEPQVVYCGIKDGQPKEYGTKSAAEADGATHIAIKTGQTCPAIQ